VAQDPLGAGEGLLVQGLAGPRSSAARYGVGEVVAGAKGLGVVAAAHDGPLHRVTLDRKQADSAPGPRTQGNDHDRKLRAARQREDSMLFSYGAHLCAIGHVTGRRARRRRARVTAMRNQAQSRRRRGLLAAGAAAGLCAALLSAGAAATAGARAQAAGGTWGKAEEVPGTAALNTSGDAQINSVSCASAGNCSAGGSYTGRHGRFEAFVVSEKNGSWGKAEEVPGTAALNTGGIAEIGSVSCASAGNCSAGGDYLNRSGRHQVFVVSQKNGSWGKAEEVPGTAALNTSGAAFTNSVSCASAGNCSAGGGYFGRGDGGFVVSQKNGSWGKAEQVPGGAALGGETEIHSVSCASAGNCSAGGSYTGRHGQFQAFVVSEKNGSWGKAVEVPGTAALNVVGNAQINSVSCSSAGNCSAGGYYAARSGQQAFVVSQAR
jgi:hypothetical protein